MWVAQQMGHSDWTMIARVYDRWMSSADETVGSKAEKLWHASSAEADANINSKQYN